jgi:hypothetical protein
VVGCLWGLVGLPSLSAATESDWAAVTAAKLSYTSDVFEFSAARRLAISDDPSQPTVVPLGTRDDWIWEPSVELLRRFSTALGRNEVAVKAHGFIYTNNPIFNHGDYRIQTTQWLGADTSILLRYRYVPNLFLGPNIERQSGQQLVSEERVTSHRWRLELQRQLSEAWRITGIGRYGLRSYNPQFSERDTWFFTVGPKVEYTPVAWATATLGYLYERGLADGRSEPQFKDDVSYFLNVVTFGTEFRFSRRVSLNLVYTYLRKNFTSGIPGDPNMGRLDQTNQGLAELGYTLTPASQLTLSFQRTQRTSTATLRDFNNTIVSIAGDYRF